MFYLWLNLDLNAEILGRKKKNIVSIPIFLITKAPKSLNQSVTLYATNFPVALFLNQNLNNLYNLYSPKLKFNELVGIEREITAAAYPAVLFSNDNVIPH